MVWDHILHFTFAMTRFFHQIRLIIGEKPGSSVLEDYYLPKPRNIQVFHSQLVISKQLVIVTSQLVVKAMKTSLLHPS